MRLILGNAHDTVDAETTGCHPSKLRCGLVRTVVPVARPWDQWKSGSPSSHLRVIEESAPFASACSGRSRGRTIPDFWRARTLVHPAFHWCFSVSGGILALTVLRIRLAANL